MSHKGILLYVARTAGRGDRTNGGVSGNHDVLTLIGTINDHSQTVVPLSTSFRGPFAPSADAPAVALEVRTVLGEKVASVVPVGFNRLTGEYQRNAWPMAGGNYAHGDSRFSDLIKAETGARVYGAVAIHDRFE